LSCEVDVTITLEMKFFVDAENHKHRGERRQHAAKAVDRKEADAYEPDLC
jgi:hypothetical protein